MDFSRIEEREKVYSNVLAVFGVTGQVLKAVEEYSELSAALCRYLNGQEGQDSENVRDDMLENLVEAVIMTEQMKYLFDDMKNGMGESLYDIRERKLERLKTLVAQRREEMRRMS